MLYIKFLSSILAEKNEKGYIRKVVSFISFISSFLENITRFQLESREDSPDCWWQGGVGLLGVSQEQRRTRELPQLSIALTWLLGRRFYSLEKMERERKLLASNPQKYKCLVHYSGYWILVKVRTNLSGPSQKSLKIKNQLVDSDLVGWESDGGVIPPDQVRPTQQAPGQAVQHSLELVTVM